MSSLKHIRQNIESNQSMKGLVEVYEEISATTMRKIRDAILASRAYYHGLSVLSTEVGADLSLLETTQTKKSALVFLSSNEGMSGEIESKVLAKFLEKVRSLHNVDIFIAGKNGEDLIKIIAPDINFSTILFEEIGLRLQSYHSVEVVFGQFESIARQEPTVRNISANTLSKTTLEWAGTDPGSKLKYLYEPSITRISTVFGENIFAGVIEQTIKESELAKNASRLMHLDESLTKIDKLLASERSKFHTLRKRITGKKQNNQVVGYRSNIIKKMQRPTI